MWSARSWLRWSGAGPAAPGPAGADRPSPSYGAPAESAPADLQSHLVALHDTYVERVNRAVAEGRLDLVRGLVDAYTEEALLAVTSAPIRP